MAFVILLENQTLNCLLLCVLYFASKQVFIVKHEKIALNESRSLRLYVVQILKESLCICWSSVCTGWFHWFQGTTVAFETKWKKTVIR